MGLIACSCFMIIKFDIYPQRVTNGFSYVLQAIISPRNLPDNTRKNRGTEHGSRDGNCNYMEVRPAMHQPRARILCPGFSHHVFSYSYSINIL